MYHLPLVTNLVLAVLMNLSLYQGLLIPLRI